MKRPPRIHAFLLLSASGLLLGGCAAVGPETGGETGSVAVATAPGEDFYFLELLRSAARGYERVSGYTADFTKQQRIRGKLLPEEEIFMKFRKPRDIYMRWTGEVDRGQEVLYAGERYGGKIIAHRGGRILSRIAVSLDPEGRRALKKNLRPITCAGIGFLIHSLLDVSERAAEEGAMSVEYRGVVETPGGEAHEFIRYLPEDKGFPCPRAVVCLDVETGFPLVYEAYDRDGNLLERYTYSDLETDEGLGDEDFDRDNDDYRFGIL